MTERGIYRIATEKKKINVVSLKINVLSPIKQIEQEQIDL